MTVIIIMFIISMISIIITIIIINNMIIIIINMIAAINAIIIIITIINIVNANVIMIILSVLSTAAVYPTIHRNNKSIKTNQMFKMQVLYRDENSFLDLMFQCQC